MSEYHGDIDLGDTVQWLFTTVDSTGLPTILTGTPTATAYTDGGIVQSATGVTLTADFDGVTGLNLVSVVASSGNGFAAGENIEIVLSAGTVGGVSVVGYAVGGFSIANRSPLRPTTIGRTLDILATGEVPIDFDTSIGTLAAAQIEASALDGKGDWNIGKTGYSLTQAFPSNFADMSITLTTGLVDITQTAADKAWAAGARTLTAGTNIVLAKGVGLTGLNDVAATDIVSSGAITTIAGSVSAVDSVAALGVSSISSGTFGNNSITAAALAADAVTEIRDAILPVSNTTLNNIPFTFVAASDHVTPVTGATGTAVTRSIDGAAFGSGTGSLAEIGNGAYSYDASAADMNGGIIIFRFTATGGTPGAPDDTFVSVITGAGV